MSLIPWRNKQQVGVEPESSPLVTLKAEMDRLFDAFTREPFGGLQWPFGSPGQWSPAIDIAESDQELTVRAEVPGMRPEDLEVTISGNQLVLAGEKKESAEKSDKGFYHTESHYGSFRRCIPLPQVVDPGKVRADYADGVVTIHLEKSHVAAPRQIEVKKKP